MQIATIILSGDLGGGDSYRVLFFKQYERKRGIATTNG